MSEEQAVVDTDTPETQAAEGGDAQGDDLDTLLNEWESRSSDKPQETETKSDQGEQDNWKPEDVKQVANWVRQKQEEEIRAQTEKDLNSAVETIKDGMENPVPDTFVKGYLYMKASEDPRFMTAWQNRGNNPEGFSRLLKAVQKSVIKDLENMPSQSATADREAVSSAVRSASKAPPEKGTPSDADLNGMSDREFFNLANKMRAGG